MKHVVSFSGGLSSWACARIVADKYGTEDMVLLFADTSYEDEDLYRFLHDAAANIGCPVTILKDGRDIWDVFYDTRFLGNSRVDKCSHTLKRLPLAKWVQDNCNLSDTIQYVGFRWDERERWYGKKGGIGFQARKAAQGQRFEAPLVDMPHMGRVEIQQWAEREGLDHPRTYELGLGGNCGGRCVRAGQKHWAQLLKVMPERFKEVEAKEAAFREWIGQDVAILRSRKGGVTKPLPLSVLREGLEAGEVCEQDNLGGCRCMQDDDEIKENA